MEIDPQWFHTMETDRFHCSDHTQIHKVMSKCHHMRTVHLENAATQTFDLFTSKPHRNHALCIPEPKQLSKIEIECLSAQFCMRKLLHLPMDWIL